MPLTYIDGAPVWPSAELKPRVLSQGYARAWPDAVQSTDMDKGVPKTRLRTANAPETIQCVSMVDFDKLQRLRAFFVTDTVFGSKPFWFPNQSAKRDGSQPGVPDLLLVMFKPGEPPQEGENAGSMFKVRFSLVVLP